MNRTALVASFAVAAIVAGALGLIILFTRPDPPAPPQYTTPIPSPVTPAPAKAGPAAPATAKRDRLAAAAPDCSGGVFVVHIPKPIFPG